MNVVYFNDHSITFIKSVNSSRQATSYKRSWYDFRLIPAKRPSVVTAKPNVRLISIPGSNVRLDLTDAMPGGLTFGRHQGEWEFYVDTTKWGGWANAKNAIEDYLNGQYLYVILEDDHDHYYAGITAVKDFSVDSDYPTVTIAYDLYYNVYNNDISYPLKPSVISISSSINPYGHIFYAGDPLDSIRKYITTLATFDNGDIDYVDVESFTGIIKGVGQQTATTVYGEKTSSVTFTAVMPAVSGFGYKLKTGKTKNVWLGSDKDDIRDIYNFFETYENGYTPTTPNLINVNQLSGIFNTLGEINEPVYYQNFSNAVPILSRKVKYLYNQKSSSFPEYMRIGEYKDRILYFVNGIGSCGDGTTYNYDRSELTLESGKFDAIGNNTVIMSAPNKAIGEYANQVYCSISVNVIEGFDIIEDTWEEINVSIADGSYKTKYKVGDLKSLVIPSIYNGYVQIVGIDKDYDEDNDTIPITWMLKEALEEKNAYHHLNAYNIPYTSTDMYYYLNTIYNQFPSLVGSMIIQSIKEYNYNTNGTASGTFVKKCDYMHIWQPSLYEISGTITAARHNYNNRIITYSELFGTDSDRIKYQNSMNISNHYRLPCRWGLREPYNYTYQVGLVNGFGFCFGASKIYTHPDSNLAYYTDQHCVVFGFCTGATAYDENAEWILRKFKAYDRTLEVYEWDTFGLASDSNLNTVYDAVEAEIDQHVKIGTASSANDAKPSVTISPEPYSETETTYTYNITFVDYSADASDGFIPAFVSKFNLIHVVSRIIQTVPPVQVTQYRITTNKLITE